MGDIHRARWAKRYREVQRRRLTFYRRLIETWVAAGVAEPLPGTDLEALVLASWVVGDQWLAYLEAMGSATSEADVKHGSRLIFEIFRPHLAGADFSA